MVNIKAKNTLAKLLAKEGITVQHGNYETAYFDVENRVLGLPIWKDMENLYDLLVGHEVGHALYTPPEGWHTADKDIPGLPKSFLNVIEDVRIEKLIQRKYPGLALSFKKGYNSLNKRDFFNIKGVTDIEAKHFKLVDRINLKAKMRNLVKVQFTPAEMPIVNKAFAVETWEDVLDVCKDLVEYSKYEPKPEAHPMIDAMNMIADKDGTPMQTESSENDNTEVDEMARPNSEASSQSDSDNEGKDKESSDETSTSESQQTDSESQGSEGEGTEGEKDKTSNSEMENEGVEDKETLEKPNKIEDLKSDTDQAQRSQEREFVERDELGRTLDIVYGMTDEQWKHNLISYQEVEQARTKLSPLWGEWSTLEQDAWISFEAQTKKFVNIMAKEFEMKKAAWRSKRAQTARSGTLDVNKLYSYKYNDDIFKRFTNMPDAKNHGMVMLIDWSGSMWQDLGSVIKQMLNLTAFCKKVHIPFDVYSFTSETNSEKRENKLRGWTKPSIDHVDHSDIKVIHMMSNKMKKSEYEKAVRAFHKMAWNFNEKGGYASKDTTLTNLEDLGMTPLNAVLTYIPTLIKKFRSDNNVQKVIFTCMTDGQSGNIDSFRGLGYSGSKRYVVDNQMLTKQPRTASRWDFETEMLLSNIKKYCENSVGYFLTRGSRHEFHNIYQLAFDQTRWDQSMDARKQFLKDKMLHLKEVCGYNDYFILKSDKSSLNTDNDEFQVSSVAKKNEITRAFRKFQKSKKANRVLATKFAEAVA